MLGQVQGACRRTCLQRSGLWPVCCTSCEGHPGCPCPRALSWLCRRCLLLGGNSWCVTAAITLPSLAGGSAAPCAPAHPAFSSTADGGGQGVMPHPCRNSVGGAAVPSRMRWEAAGNKQGAKNANQDHAAKQRSSLSPAVAPGDSSSRTGHPAPCCSCCIQQGGVLEPVLLAAPKKATPPCQITSPLGLARLGSLPGPPSSLGRCPAASWAQECPDTPEGRVGTPMAAHPRSTPTSWFVPPGAASLWHGGAAEPS